MAEQPQITASAYLRLVALGALVGIPAALVAALFLALVHDIEHWLWHDLPDALGHASPPWYLVIGLPMVGAARVVSAAPKLGLALGYDVAAALEDASSLAG